MFGIYIDYTSSARLLLDATSPDIVLKRDIELNRSFQYIFPIPIFSMKGVTLYDKQKNVT